MGIDAFTIDWHGINGCFVPPVWTINRRIYLTVVSSFHVELLLDSHSDHIQCAILEGVSTI
jgi:hypothetical protein